MITHFTIQCHSKNFTCFTNFNSLDIKNNMLSKHSQKTFHFTKFSSRYVSVWCQKKNCTAPFSDAQELNFCSTLKANVCIFLYISLRKFLFQRLSKILSGGIRGRGRLNNFLMATCCLSFVKCFTIFHFN